MKKNMQYRLILSSLSIMICCALILSIAVMGLITTSAEDTAIDYPILLAKLDGTEATDTVGPGLGTIASTKVIDRDLNFTATGNVKNFINVTKLLPGTNLDLSGADVFTFTLTVTDNGAWDFYKDYMQVKFHRSSGGMLTIPAADVAEGLSVITPGKTQKIKINLNNISDTELKNITGINFTFAESECELNLHVKITDIKAEVVASRVFFAKLNGWEYPLIQPGLASSAANAKLDRYLNFTENGDVKNFVQANRTAVSSMGVVDISLCDYFAFNLWVEDNGAWEIYKDYISIIINGDKNYTVPADVTAQALSGVVPGTWSRIYIDLNSIDKAGLTATKYFRISVEGNGQTSDLNLHIQASDAYGEVAYDDIMIVDDEADEKITCGGGIDTTVAKIGDKSYKCVAWDKCFLIQEGFNGDSGLPVTKDITKITDNGSMGYLRFWVYADTQADLDAMAKYSSDISIGDTITPDGVTEGKGAWIVWQNWDNQVTKLGWNEVILPFSAANKTGTVDFANIRSMRVRLNGVDNGFTVNFDDFRISYYGAPTVESFEDIVIIDEENGEYGAYAEISDVMAIVGSKSLAINTVENDGWVTFKGFYGEDPVLPKDISVTTNNGKMGAIRFWLYVADVSSFDEVKELENKGAYSILKLGTAKNPDGSYFCWNGWANQVTKNGWNEIILPFANCFYETGIAPDTTVIDTIYIKLPTGAPSINLFIDNIKVSEDINPSPVYGDFNGDNVCDIRDMVRLKKLMRRSFRGIIFCGG